MSDRPDQVHDSGDAEHLGQSVLPADIAERLRAETEEQQERAQLVQEAQSLGLVGDGETIGPDEARERIEAHQAEQREQARAAIASIGEAEPAGPADPPEASSRPERDDRGRRLFPSRFDPERMVARMRPGDRQEIEQLVQWYTDWFNYEDLTAQQALGLILDARAQGLYRRDRDTHMRTPIAVSDDELRGRITELFGERDDEGRAEERLRELRAREGGANRDDESQSRSWTGEELRGTLEAFEARIQDLEETDPDSREKWMEILEDFLAEQLLDENKRVPSNIQSGRFREWADRLFKRAEKGYTAATSKAGFATTEPEARAHARNAGGNPGSENQPDRLTLEELRGRVDALETRVNELSQDDQATWEQWKQILDDFFAQGIYEYNSDGKRASTIRNSELRNRAQAVFKRAIQELDDASRRGRPDSGDDQAGENLTGGSLPGELDEGEFRTRLDEMAARFNALNQDDQATWEQWRQILEDFLAQGLIEHDDDASRKAKRRRASTGEDTELRERAVRLYERIRRAERQARERPYDNDEATEAEMAATGRDDDPSGQLDEDRVRFDTNRELLQRSAEPIPVDTVDYQPPQVTVAGEQVHRVDPLEARAVERVRREWQRRIDAEPDPDERRRLQGIQQDLMDIERDRIRAELRLERERRQGR